jgi:putative chitinase
MHSLVAELFSCNYPDLQIDGQVMFEVAPRFSGTHAKRQSEIIKAISPVLASTLENYSINTRLRIAHFLGQTCHEAAGYRTTEEFASGQAYEGRTDLGNVKKGDGRRYKGRGLIQLTGRANYRDVGKELGVDLEGNPLVAADPQLSLRIACEYWERRKINPDCDRDNIITVTKKINGGLNGLDDRRHYTAKAKAALARIEGFVIAGSNPDTRPVLHRGAVGEAVGHLQEQLQRLHYPIAIDGDFGPATELAVMQFQAAHRLTADGIVGPRTWSALEKAAKKAA